MGNASAAEKLVVPECPEEVEYLVEWAYKLVGRSGAGFSTLNPLSYLELEAWARLNDINLAVEEVEALIIFDEVIRSPSREEQSEAGEPPKSKEKPVSAWPQRRVEPQIQEE